ncbi:MAG: hypothetical protein LUC47_03710 [Clostridiales bacterium]|nr:hypothetical protein [Clostridiales bacterium]
MSRTSKFVKERNAALFSLDRDTIEKYMKKYDIPIPENETVFWASIYKCICSITDAPQELVAEAKEWLYAHGMSAGVTNVKIKYN